MIPSPRSYIKTALLGGGGGLPPPTPLASHRWFLLLWFSLCRSGAMAVIKEFPVETLLYFVPAAMIIPNLRSLLQLLFISKYTPLTMPASPAKQDKTLLHILKTVYYIAAMPFIFPAFTSTFGSLKDSISTWNVQRIADLMNGFMILQALYLFEMFRHPIECTPHSQSSTDTKNTAATCDSQPTKAVPKKRSNFLQQLGRMAHHLAFTGITLGPTTGRFNLYDVRIAAAFLAPTLLSFPLNVIMAYYHSGESLALKGRLLQWGGYWHWVTNTMRIVLSLLVYGIHFKETTAWFRIFFPLACIVWNVDQWLTWKGISGTQSKSSRFEIKN